MLITGKQNLITDVAGIQVGNSASSQYKSGTTVLTAQQPFAAAVDVRGGAPGTRETDLLAPDKLVEKIDAIVLSGGSAFGLDAASGVMDAMAQQGRGYEVGPVRVPIVSSAILFDLLNGGEKSWQHNPYRALGVQALANANSTFDLGSVGAGSGANCADFKGGLGSASLMTSAGYVVGALVAVNPRGGVCLPGSNHFWAAPYEVANEFGGAGWGNTPPDLQLSDPRLAAIDHSTNENPRANTTIAIVATDAALSVSQLKRMAIAAHDGIARAIVPSHTPLDGDTVFAVSTAMRSLKSPVADQTELCHAASVCLSRAIARGVYHATPAENDPVPCWQSE